MDSNLNFAPGMLLLLRYGLGTQVARVVSVDDKHLIVLRGTLDKNVVPGHEDKIVNNRIIRAPRYMRFCWTKFGEHKTSKLNDKRILGELPAEDSRRLLPGFND